MGNAGCWLRKKNRIAKTHNRVWLCKHLAVKSGERTWAESGVGQIHKSGCECASVFSRGSISLALALRRELPACLLERRCGERADGLNIDRAAARRRRRRKRDESPQKVTIIAGETWPVGVYCVLQDHKLKHMADLQQSVVSDAETKRQITGQIVQWEENLERLHCEQFRLRCYMASLQSGELPNPKASTKHPVRPFPLLLAPPRSSSRRRALFSKRETPGIVPFCAEIDRKPASSAHHVRAPTHTPLLLRRGARANLFLCPLVWTPCGLGRLLRLRQK